MKFKGKRNIFLLTWINYTVRLVQFIRNHYESGKFDNHKVAYTFAKEKFLIELIEA